MDYLNRVLGIRVVSEDTELKSMPNFIYSRYRLQKVRLDGKPAIFLYPKAELDAVNAIKKHMDRVSKAENAPAVLVPDHLTYRQKEYLLRDRVPFIVEGKQIYLPFMAVCLQERGNGEKPETETMLPSAQLLLLLFIYNGCGELLTSNAARELGLTPTSISRASKQLEEMGILFTQKRGVQKILISEQTPEQLFAVSKKFFSNPVKRTIYVPKADIKEDLLISGFSALSEYTMLNPPAVEYFATDSVAVWNNVASKSLQNSEEECAVELWRYDPRILAEGKSVDRLSLALSLMDDRDERVEETVDAMLLQVWRDIDGKRN